MQSVTQLYCRAKKMIGPVIMYNLSRWLKPIVYNELLVCFAQNNVNNIHTSLIYSRQTTQSLDCFGSSDCWVWSDWWVWFRERPGFIILFMCSSYHTLTKHLTAHSHIWIDGENLSQCKDESPIKGLFWVAKWGTSTHFLFFHSLSSCMHNRLMSDCRGAARSVKRPKSQPKELKPHPFHSVNTGPTYQA